MFFLFYCFCRGESQWKTIIWENMFGTFSKHLKQIQVNYIDTYFSRGITIHSFLEKNNVPIRIPINQLLCCDFSAWAPTERKKEFWTMLMCEVKKHWLVGFYRGWNSTMFGGDHYNQWNENPVIKQYFTEYTKPPHPQAVLWNVTKFLSLLMWLHRHPNKPYVRHPSCKGVQHLQSLKLTYPLLGWAYWWAMDVPFLY